MNHKKILYVGPSYKINGGIASVLSQYKNYLENDFRFFSTIDSSYKLINFVKYPFKIFSLIIFLILNKEIKIIHIHGASRGSFYRKYLIFLICKFFFNKKVIYHIHGGEYHLFFDDVSSIVRKMINHMISNSDVLIVLSKKWKLFFQDNFQHKSIEIVNNIVEETNSIDKVDKGKSVLTLLFLGKICTGKGIFDVLKSIKKNKEFFKNKLKLIIGGDGEINRLNDFILKNNITNYVEYVGWISGKKKNDLLLKSDIMILTSYNEGLPISLLEGLSYKMPLISSHVGGISEILEHKKNGFVVKPGNIKEITEAIKFYLENELLIKLHGRNSYDIAKRYFPKNVFFQLNNIYKDLLK